MLRQNIIVMYLTLESTQVWLLHTPINVPPPPKPGSEMNIFKMVKCHFKWNLHVAATTKAHKGLSNAWTVDCYASVRRKSLKERNGSKDCLTDGVVARTWASFVPKMVPSFIWTWEAQPSFIWLAHTHNTASISSAILSQKCPKKTLKMSRDVCTNHSKPPPLLLHGEAAQRPQLISAP